MGWDVTEKYVPWTSLPISTVFATVNEWHYNCLYLEHCLFLRPLVRRRVVNQARGWVLKIAGLQLGPTPNRLVIYFVYLSLSRKMLRIFYSA